MGTTATTTVTGGRYRCRCDSDRPSFVLSMLADEYVGSLPEFKLRLRFANSSSNGSVVVVEETLCGYGVHNFEDSRFYRLVYRSEKNGSGGTSFPPVTSAPSHDDDVIECAVDAGQEERRLNATE